MEELSTLLWIQLPICPHKVPLLLGLESCVSGVSHFDGSILKSFELFLVGIGPYLTRTQPIHVDVPTLLHNSLVEYLPLGMFAHLGHMDALPPQQFFEFRI